ncbi:MAG: sigma-70 family RNA polymerase sigma factor [Cyclobacteriaceae bacterium]
MTQVSRNKVVGFSHGQDLIRQDDPVSEEFSTQLDSLPDSQIWELFRQGQEIAFIHIYKKNFDLLFQYGCHFTNNVSLVEDAIQDMFIELREKRKNTVIKDSVKNYLFTCLRRRVLLYLDKFDNKFETLNRAHLGSFRIGISVEQRIIERQISDEQNEKLGNSLKLLSSRQREAIYFFYNEGMEYREIKELMNFSNIRSVRNLIYRALKTIRSSLHS